MSTRRKKHMKMFFKAVRRLFLTLVVFGVLTVSFSQAEVAYTYIPEDQVGDFYVLIDAFRMFEATWKKIPVLVQWGEIYGPICNCWGYTAFAPSGPNVKGIKNYNVPRDVIVKVERNKNRVEYTWKYCDFDAGYRQVNKVIVAPEIIRCDTALQFIKKPKREVEFHPVLFPGGISFTGGASKIARETAILGKECLIRRKDGTEYKKIYPDQKEGFNWLEGDTREITFNLPKGKIQFSFSSNDEKMTLSFLGSSYSPYMQRNRRRSIIGVLRIHPVIGKIINIHMDIRTGKKVGEKPETAERLDFGEDIAVRVKKSNASGVYLPDEKVEFSVNLDNRWSDKDRNVEVLYEVVNYENKVIYGDKQSVSIGKEEKVSCPVILPVKEFGIFYLNITVKEERGVVEKRTVSFVKVFDPIDCPEDKSFFGCDAGRISRPPVGAYSKGEIKNNDDMCQALYSLGIKRLRLLDHNIYWKNLEKEPGKFTFNPNSDIVVDTILKHKMGVWLSCFGGNFPGWALKKGKKHETSHARDANIPDDWSLYEEYMYRVAEHFKGRVKYYEEANEPYLNMPWTPVRNQFVSALYRGVKRGDPDAKVTGCATFCIRDNSFDKIKSFLEYKDSYKEIDIITPHYFISGQVIGKRGGTLGVMDCPPEDKLDDVRRLVALARKYNVEVWGGEDGHKALPENSFPLGRFYDFQKAFINLNARDYLLKKSFPDIKYNSLCWAIAWCGFGTFINTAHGPGMQNDYMAGGNAIGFWGTGGNILPFAAAHAASAHLLDTSEFQGRIRRGSEDFYCFRFSRGKENMAALWMKKGKAEWVVDLPGGIEYINVVGRTQELSGKKKITITGEPFYLYSRNIREAKFVELLNAGSLIPDRVITIQGIKFSNDKKSLEVIIKNNCPEEVKLDFVSIKYGKYKDSLKHAKIPADKETRVSFKLKKEIENNLFASVRAGASGKTYKKEQFVLFPSVKSARSYGYLIALKAKGSVKIDGDLSEWKDAIPIVVKDESRVKLGKGENPWKGPDDLSAIGYVMWDDKNLYFACKVTDDVYANPYVGRDSGWKGDSIQLAFDPKMDNPAYGGYNSDDQEINISLSGKEPFIFRRTFGERRAVWQKTDGRVAGARLAIKPWEEGLIYELSLPIKELTPLRGEEEEIIRFNFIVNDNDGKGRMWMGITGGIGKKAPSLYKKMIFLE